MNVSPMLQTSKERGPERLAEKGLEQAQPNAKSNFWPQPVHIKLLLAAQTTTSHRHYTAYPVCNSSEATG